MAPVAVMFCGNLGSIELDSVAMANSVFSGLGTLVCHGMATACDTLFSQTFGSSKQYLLGLSLQKSLIIMTLASLLCISVHINTTPLLLQLGQNPEVAKLAGDYILIMVPGMFCFFINITLTKYIQCQNIVLPTMYISCAALVCCGVLHMFFVHYLDLGTQGSALAHSICHVIILVLTILYIFISGMYKKTWQPISSECLKDWGSFLKLASSGLLMLCTVGLTWEAGIILSGLLGTIEQGAQAVVFNVRLMTFMLPLGTGIAASIRVGQNLGAKNADAARKSAFTAFFTVLMISLCTGLLCYCLRFKISYLITSDPKIGDVVADTLPIVSCFFILDGIYAIYSTLFRSSGRQNEGAIVQFFGYAVGNTVAVYLLFKTSLGIKGYWLALSLALVIINTIYTVLFLRTDWHGQVDRAQKRIKPQNYQYSKLQPYDVLDHMDDVSIRKLFCKKVSVVLIVLSVLLSSVTTRVLLLEIDSSISRNNTMLVSKIQ